MESGAHRDEWQRPNRPRSAGYDRDWLLDLDMGPHPLWLLEDLIADLGLAPGMRVLDLGCGRGASAVFLAREYGVEVSAVDLWVSEEDLRTVVREAGVDDRVSATNADARNLPFPADHFDAVVSIDAWEYFGTDDRFLPGLLRVVRPDGIVAVATPCLRQEFPRFEDCPAHVRDLAGWEASAWHTPEWWQRQWQRSGLVDVLFSRAQETGWRDWWDWTRAIHDRAGGQEAVLAMLEADRGEHLSFALVAGRKRSAPEAH